MYKVYLADDESWIIFTLKNFIEESGLPFKIIGESNDGVTALEEIEQKKPDVAFLDIRMPGYTGIEVLRLIKEKKLEVKTVFITGYEEFSYAKEALHLGAVDYLLKPVKSEEVVDVLKKIAETSEDSAQEYTIEKEKDTSLIGQVINEIQERYTENITIKELAKKYGISAGYLSTLIKDNLGMPFPDYLAAKRIQKAKELMENEMLSLEQISEMAGFRDNYYFSKVFKKYTGISPAKYRKEL